MDILLGDKIASFLKSEAAHYDAMLVDGPHRNLFTGEVGDDQLMETATILRTGDMLLVAARTCSPQPVVDESIRRLEQSMLALAGRGLMYERPEQVVSESNAQHIVAEMTGFPAPDRKPLSVAIAENMMGEVARFKTIWGGLQGAAMAINQYGESAFTESFFKRLSSACDDNDLSCVLSNVGREVLPRYFEEGDEAAGELAYLLYSAETMVMPGNDQLTRQQYFDYEGSRRDMYGEPVFKSAGASPR